LTVYKAHSDNDLLLLIRQNSNEMAFTEIYNRYWEQLFAIAYNRIRELQPAEDIVQDVFMSLWNNRQKSEVSVLQHYLAAAVKYMTLAYLRKSGKMVTDSEDVLHALQSESLEQQLKYKELLHIIQKETDKLPERCRLIFRYSRQEGLSTRQIAQELNISPRTVETQISKALRVLRETIRRSTQIFF
jgi:RNA polymerase sigma-70 factor (ECF subfamily)